MKKTLKSAAASAIAVSIATSSGLAGWESKDGSTQVNGYLEERVFYRFDRGISKLETTGQAEIDKDFRPSSFFSSLTGRLTLRGRYEGVYDVNSDEFGADAGGPIMLQSDLVPGGFVPFGGGLDVTSGLLPPDFFFPAETNPNDGLTVLGFPQHAGGGGFTTGAPVRPCNVDNRGCLDGLLDFDEDELRFPDFNKRLDFLREAFIDASIPAFGDDELGVRIGRQQIVWGRTDLFRVLDVINPLDFSRHSIFDEFEDTRIPQWMLQTEYRAGPTGFLDDLNFAVVWNFDRFRPNNLGQGGSPYSALGVGPLVRALANCYQNGCTIANFTAPGGPGTPFAAFNFGPGTVGIRGVNEPEWALDNTQWGVKIEGVLRDVSFSLNYYDYFQQNPSFRGGIPVNNPFIPGAEPRASFDFLPAFDVAFPRVKLFGGSLDYYWDPLKTVFRLETTYTTGEEFANTLRPEVFSEHDVVRYVIGIDRDTFIPFLNRENAFAISGQLFGQHILDHELESRPLGEAGIPDWENNWIATLLIRGNYKYDTINPQVLFAYDMRAGSGVVGPSVDWIMSDRLRVILGANIKFGRSNRVFDDLRSADPFGLAGAPGAPSLGLGSFEPLGRFRSGIFGMSQDEDELQLTVRYRF